MKQLTAIIALALAFGSCTFDKGEIPRPVTGFVCTGTQTRTVLVKDDFFEPSTVDACVGDTIKWVYTASNPHTTTSLAIPAGAAAWNVAMTSSSNTTYTYVVDTTGTYNYECIYHTPGMTGRIIVH